MTQSLITANRHRRRASFFCIAAVSTLLVFGLIGSGCQSKSEDPSGEAAETGLVNTPTPSPALDPTSTEGSADDQSAPETMAEDESLDADEPTRDVELAVEGGIADASTSSELPLLEGPKPNDPRIAGPEPPERTPVEMAASESDASEPDGSEPSGPLTAAELDEEYVPDPEIMAEIEAQRKALRRIADTYGPPPGAVQLGEQPDLWVDMKTKRVYIDGYVSMKRGPLEMLACPIGTKEHESVVAVFAKSSEVHAALLAIGAQSGTTARWDPEFLPPTGQTILVWVTYREPMSGPAEDDNDRYRPFVPGEKVEVVDARRWIRNVETQEALSEPWVFSGSEFWTDPDENIERYSANAGDMICVSNFSTAMMDVPFASSADAGNTLFQPFAERIPDPGTPVRLVLVPQPIPTDQPEPQRAYDPTAQPDESVLPASESNDTEPSVSEPKS